MGMITIQTGGSFGGKRKEFFAIKHGHAHAVAEAIEWLSSELLKEAINSDHKLHDEGSKPSEGFGKP